MILGGKRLFSSMKPKTITWCVVLAALAGTVLISVLWKRKPSEAPGPVSTPSPEITRSEVTLSEGDPAPKLFVSKWIQGEPIKSFEPGTVYLMSFWSTWWLPCREAMAHVNRLHQKYKDKGLVVIGQNAKESAGTDVEPFIKRMGNLMTYRIALDEGATNRLSGKMLENWLFAAEAGIPTAFLIDRKGNISFIGHPEEIDNEVIEQVLTGTFDPKQRAADREAAAAKAEAWEKHNELGKKAWKAKQWDTALSEIDTLEKLFPHKRITAQCLRMTVLVAKEDFETASKLALQLSNDNLDDPYLQHRVARTLANQARLKYRIEGSERDLIMEGSADSVILKTANMLMERANSMIKGPEPEFLHTQARLAFLQNRKEEAIQLETKAMALAEPGIKDQFTDALENFKRGRLPQ